MRNEIDNPWRLPGIDTLATANASSDTGYVIIENALSPQQSRGRKSAVEPARNVPYETSVSRDPLAKEANRKMTKLETRPYFVVGDLLANSGLGALVGVCCALVIPQNWSSFVAMMAGMFLGMLIAIPVQLASSLLLGAFETMLPMMLSGMSSGMLVAMMASQGLVPWRDGLATGALAGLAVVAFTYVMNALLTREANPSEAKQ